MTPLEMAAAAAEALAEPGMVGVLLTMPKGKMPRGFPRGELINEMKRNGVLECTYHFNPERVLAWLVKHGLIVIERTGEHAMSFREP